MRFIFIVLFLFMFCSLSFAQDTFKNSHSIFDKGVFSFRCQYLENLEIKPDGEVNKYRLKKFGFKLNDEKIIFGPDSYFKNAEFKHFQRIDTVTFKIIDPEENVTISYNEGILKIAITWHDGLVAKVARCVEI